MVAPIGTKERCRLSIMMQHLFKVQHKFTIPGTHPLIFSRIQKSFLMRWLIVGRAFVPKPDVDVGVVHFTPLVTPKIKAPFGIVEKVARNTFQFRQKYCRRGLEMLFPSPTRSENVETLLRLADIDGTLRPFELSVEEFNRIVQAYLMILEKYPSFGRYNSRSQDNDTFVADEIWWSIFFYVGKEKYIVI